MSMPKQMKAIVLQQSPPDRNPLYHDAALTTRPIPELKEGEVLVKMNAAGFNHREVWLRMGFEPTALAIGNVMGADGAGTVVASSNPKDPLLNNRVLLAPSRGWLSDPDGPESGETLRLLGGTTYPLIGTFSEYVVVERDQVIPSPEHLDDVHVAAWPLGGVTAWRAVTVKGKLCVAKGANVYVTSSSEDKIRKAVELGAKRGVSYKDANWPSQMATLLSRDGKGNAKPSFLDVVIDAGGGDIMIRVNQILKQGGSVVCYGMAGGLEANIKFTMQQVLKNHHLLGSTMGSRQDLVDATAFLSAHRIVPVVSHVLDGLEQAEEGFEHIRKGGQFGKAVINIARPSVAVG